MNIVAILILAVIAALLFTTTTYYATKSVKLGGELDAERSRKTASDEAMLKIAHVAGVFKARAEQLYEQNTKLIGANDFLAEKVIERREFTQAIQMLADTACTSCRKKKNGKYPCDECEVAAAKELYAEQAEAAKKPAGKPKPKLCGSCDFCKHDAQCNGMKVKGGTIMFPLYAPPAEEDKAEIDCMSFAVAEPEEPKPEAVNPVTEKSCANCAKVESCDKSLGSGYVPNTDNECQNWGEIVHEKPTQAWRVDSECQVCAKRDECEYDQYDDSAEEPAYSLYSPTSFDNGSCTEFVKKEDK